MIAVRRSGAPGPSLVRRLVQLGLLLFALVLLGEFVLTILGWRHRSVPALLEARTSLQDQTAGASRRWLTFHPQRMFTTASHVGGRAATGEWPFRGRPAEPAPAGILQVAVLGDSGVHGVQLFERDTLLELRGTNRQLFLDIVGDSAHALHAYRLQSGN